MLQIKNLTKSYGDIRVLRGLNAHIHRGEVVSVIGPSGCGKSTLLRCINQLETPDSGSILLDGRETLGPRAGRADLRRRVGMVFQRWNLFAHLTVMQNLTLGPVHLLGLTQAEAEARATALLKSVGLADRAGAMPDQLSGGQQQRAAIARALCMEPEALLFDEPTSALDPIMVDEALGVIQRLADEGRTMIIVTHEMDFVRQVSTRVLFLDEGAVYEEGTPDQIFNHPAKPNTRAFVNRTKTLTVTLFGDDAPAPAASAGDDTRATAYSLRALNHRVEDFCLSQRAPRAAANRLQLVIEEMLQNAHPEDRAQVTVEYSPVSGQLTGRVRRSAHGQTAAGPDPISAAIIRGVCARLDERAEGDTLTTEFDIQ